MWLGILEFSEDVVRQAAVCRRLVWVISIYPDRPAIMKLPRGRLHKPVAKRLPCAIQFCNKEIEETKMIVMALLNHGLRKAH
jgi:hypothetical protein